MLKANSDAIAEASRAVKAGKLVIYPTDTVYGLGCSPFAQRAVERIFEVKERARKPLPILAASFRAAERVARLDGRAKKLGKAFWPGPLTIVVKKKEALPSYVTCGSDSVGVRVPKHPVALRLLRLSGGLMVGTSANKSGRKPPRTAEEAGEQLGSEVDLVLDSGPTSISRESTVVDLTQRKAKILREGPIGIRDVERILDVETSPLDQREGGRTSRSQAQ